MSNYKLGRMGSNFILADFDTGNVRLFNSSGKYLNSLLVGTPSLSSVSVISLVQVGSRAVVYNGLVERGISSAPRVLSRLLSSKSISYPLQYEGTTVKGLKYKQYIFCYNNPTEWESTFSSL